MAKAKTPQEKKALSLKRDRRNVYGESTKGTRVGIPRSKQQSKQAERRAAKQPLLAVSGGDIDDQAALAAQDASFAAGTLKRRKGFRKSPDLPLGEVLRFRKVPFSNETRNRDKW
jgi:hypothetical protein